jgi:hypothetical protein
MGAAIRFIASGGISNAWFSGDIRRRYKTSGNSEIGNREAALCAASFLADS